MPTPRWRRNHGPSTCSTRVSTVKQYHMPYKQHRCILGAVWGDSDGGIGISSWDPSAGKTCGNSTCYVLMIITRTNACQTTSIPRLRRPYSGGTGGQKMASGRKFSPMASRLLMVTIGGQKAAPKGAGSGFQVHWLEQEGCKSKSATDQPVFSD